MPAVLTEVGFISSPAEEQYMRSAAGQNEIVTDLSNAVLAYKKSVKK
jgi:N-acetylmuramoyl-L-alanine amidase